ncbi:conserved hypothetical protein [Leishmania major strain Friedlin]|uniref:Uncharacterized protein n=1 Tax=Leishmania major TaxID=5664 RepID=Q4QHV4_LEIMA|nr:conserved hypothetical protein [Leishmania major strain Friedlin]CAG9569685.1 hypothetical_protein_-__conserved [Leishmania major strain Friedlin]CAJ02654.1 conserved hypothetical protein [Leishmania major strain Friedlin]|eukprot:XP_001681244.1 conserved hypothetical protein [Leishmania major strain Friedlin]
MYSFSPVTPGKTAASPANDLVSSSSNSNGELVDDIKESLDRIEKLLNRGQQLLYGDGAADGKKAYSEGAAVTPDGEPADADTVSIPTARHVDANCGSYQLPSDTHVGLPLRGTGTSAAANASLYPQSTSQHSASHFQRNSEKLYQRLSGESNHRYPSQNGSNRSSLHARPHANRASVGSNRLPPGFKDKVLVSVRGRRIVQIQKEGGIVPNFEEGLDAHDTPQNFTIEELKARIHRELEEYRRLGPLMNRYKSFRRRQCVTVAKRAPMMKIASRTFTAATTAALGSKLVKHIPAPASASTPQGAANRFGVHAAAATTKTGPHAAPASRQAAKSTNGTPARSTLRNSHERGRVETRRADRGSHPPMMAPPGNSTYSAYYNPLQMSGGSRNASCELSLKQTAGCSDVVPQHARNVSKSKPRTTEPQDDMEEASLPDSMEDCDASQPYVAPLDLSVIKK